MRACRRVALLTALALLCALGGVAHAAPGAIDTSFGNGGELRMLPSNEDIAIRAVTTQPDNKIVLVGGDQIVGRTIVLRLLPSGERDPSFGTGGLVSLQVGSEASEGRAVVLQPDGKIVVTGTAKGATKYGFSVLRLNADGSPDTGFGAGNGATVVNLGAEGDYGRALALGPGGRIVVTGEVRLPPSDSAVGVVVLGANGQPDPTYFGGDGLATFTTTQKYDDGVAVTMLADGRVLFADSNGAGGGKGFTLAQLLQSGLPDPSFGGGDGLVEVSPPSLGAPAGLGGRITDFEPLADGRIVATGYGYDQVGSPPKNDAKEAVARFLADGQLDPSFGSGGFFTHQFGPFGEQPDWIGVTPSGRPVIAGTNVVPDTPSIDSPAIARLEPNGGLDPTFGAAGVVLNGVTAPFGEYMEAAALDPEERIVVVGRAYIGGGNTEVVLRRYLGDKVPAGPKGPNAAPHARMKKVAKKVKPGKPRGFSGTASDADGSVAKVQVAVARLVRGGAKAAAKRRAPRCLAMKNARAKFKAVKPVGPKGKRTCPQRWLTAKGTAKWSFKLKKALPPGRYVVYARAVDAEGLAETTFSRKAGNRYAFRVLARPAR